MTRNRDACSDTITKAPLLHELPWRKGQRREWNAWRGHTTLAATMLARVRGCCCVNDHHLSSSSGFIISTFRSTIPFPVLASITAGKIQAQIKHSEQDRGAWEVRKIAVWNPEEDIALQIALLGRGDALIGPVIGVNPIQAVSSITLNKQHGWARKPPHGKPNTSTKSESEFCWWSLPQVCSRTGSEQH